MTKESVLEEEATEACLTPTQKLLVLSAMDEYAKQQVVAFQKWTNQHGWFWNPNQWLNYHGEHTPMTTEELYSLFTTNI